MLTGLPSAASRTQASSHSVSVGQTRAHMPPMMLASRMVIAAPARFPAAIWRMNRGMSIDGRAGPLARRVEAEIAALRLDLRLVEGERRMQVGEIGLESSAVQSAGANVGHSRRVGGDRHGRNPGASEGPAKSFLTVWSIVRAARGVCQAQGKQLAQLSRGRLAVARRRAAGSRRANAGRTVALSVARTYPAAVLHKKLG